MKNARYICVEGTEGVGKTTQCNLLAQNLMAAGYRVLLTKEPGSVYSPLTMILRTIMLDKQYDGELTQTARELVSQAIRSIHLEKVIYPNLNNYDFIIQDRGMLSGLAYGVGCGNDKQWIEDLMQQVIDPLKETGVYDLYSDVIYLQGNVAKGLATAQNAKQEFKAGDAIEAKGVGFMHNVSDYMGLYSKDFRGVKYINVDGKGIEQVSKEILEALEIMGGTDGRTK